MEWKDKHDIREVHLKFNKSEMYLSLPDTKDLFCFITVNKVAVLSVINNVFTPVTRHFH